MELDVRYRVRQLERALTTLRKDLRAAGEDERLPNAVRARFHALADGLDGAGIFEGDS